MPKGPTPQVKSIASYSTLIPSIKSQNGPALRHLIALSPLSSPLPPLPSFLPSFLHLLLPLFPPAFKGRKEVSQPLVPFTWVSLSRIQHTVPPPSQVLLNPPSPPTPAPLFPQHRHKNTKHGPFQGRMGIPQTHIPFQWPLPSYIRHRTLLGTNVMCLWWGVSSGVHKIAFEFSCGPVP